MPKPDRPWDARLARRLVTPFADSWITSNVLTTVRLMVGVVGAPLFAVWAVIDYRRMLRGAPSKAAQPA